MIAESDIIFPSHSANNFVVCHITRGKSVRIFFKAGLIAVALTASSVACAQGYVLGSIGRTTVDLDKGRLDGILTSAGAAALSSSLDKNDTGYKIQVGYQVNPNLAVEGGWIDLGKASYSATFTGGNAKADVKASGFNIAALGILPINASFSFFGKLGLIDAKVDASASAVGAGGAAWASATATNWKPYLGLGGTFNVNKQIGIRAEYEQFNKLGDANTTGRGNVDLLSLGVVFKF
jgi:OOP family OmpA-OmpF porin